ncbi:hypothetical protein Pan258_06280 [Symmachiella dynata]|nr:hypothetical protein Pan258_06280 [Symmachiella dynata]
MEATITDGIVIGGAGGAIAGFSVWLTQLAQSKILEWRDKKRVHKWLVENTSNNATEQFRSTRAIASWTNLTEDRIRYVCSIHRDIFLSTGDKDDMWGLYVHTPRSVYEERGLHSL